MEEIELRGYCDIERQEKEEKSNKQKARAAGKKLDVTIEQYRRISCARTENEAREDECREILKLAKNTEFVLKSDIENRRALHIDIEVESRSSETKAWRELNRSIQAFERACLDYGIEEGELREKENRTMFINIAEELPPIAFADIEKLVQDITKTIEEVQKKHKRTKKEASLLIKAKRFFDGMRGKK